MNLYKISQDKNICHDTYDSAVVAAPDEDTARKIQPNEYCVSQYSWCSHPNMVKVEYLGKADKDIEQGVILASFNAG